MVCATIVVGRDEEDLVPITRDGCGADLHAAHPPRLHEHGDGTDGVGLWRRTLIEYAPVEEFFSEPTDQVYIVHEAFFCNDGEPVPYSISETTTEPPGGRSGEVQSSRLNLRARQLAF